MSDHIPVEIQEEIMKRLPVKSLIRFRLVSKQWNSMIHDSNFIHEHHTCDTHQQHHLLVTYKEGCYQKYVSIVDDDDAFPQHEYVPNVPISVIALKEPRIAGSSKGLVCLYGDSTEKQSDQMAVIWNPTVNKCVAIPLFNMLSSIFDDTIGFGFCANSNDPKLVKITDRSIRTMRWNIDTSPPWQVEVFTLSSRAWRNISCSSITRNLIILTWEQVDIEGFIYWIAKDIVERYYMVMSFDMTSEEFTEIHMPDSLTRKIGVRISKLRESLVLIERDYGANEQVFSFWIMEHGIPNSFKKLFTFNNRPGAASIRGVLGFRKNGEPIIGIHRKSFQHDALYAYDPHTKLINYIRDSGVRNSCFVSSFVETLLLLNQEDCRINVAKCGA